MVPKVQGAEDIHYVDRLLAQLEAKAGLERPILVHAILETARGDGEHRGDLRRLAADAGSLARPGRPRRRPADEDDPRGWRTPRLPGAPGPRVLGPGDIEADRPTYQQDLWHYTIARMVDACAMHGIYPYYGPFGDITDVVACEDQFRNAFLLGCVGTWSLHPKQIAIANKVFSPSPEDVAHARRVVEAMGDGTGAVMLDGKMEDDASLKQCLVMVELAEQLAEIDPELKKQYDALSRTPDGSTDVFRPRRSVLYMPSSNERALEKAKSIPCDGADPRPRGRRRPRRQGRPPVRPPARPLPRVSTASGKSTIRVNGADTEWHADDLAAACAGRAGRDRGAQGQLAPTRCSSSSRRWPATTLPEHTKLWAMVETPYAMLHAEEIASASDRLTVLVMGTNDLAKELYAEHVPGRQPLLTGLVAGAARRPRDRQGDHRRRLQRREEHRRLPGRVPAGPRDGLRRQDPDPPRPGRGRQRGLRALGAGRRGRPRHPPGLGGRRAAPASSPTTAG